MPGLPPPAALAGVGRARELASANRRLEVSVWELTGRVLFQRGRFEEAKHAYERCLELVKDVSPAPQALARHHLGRTDDALRLLTEALPLARQGEDDVRTEARTVPKYEAGALVRLIALAESRGDIAMVRLHLERLLEVYEASRHPDVASLRS